MPLASWLFLKGTETIWVERPFGTTLIVAGPGKNKREEQDFADEAALDRYQIRLAERLTMDGWFLWGVNRDRRNPAKSAGRPDHAPERRASR